jgi:hypothetical protein
MSRTFSARGLVIRNNRAAFERVEELRGMEAEYLATTKRIDHPAPA